MSRGEKSGIITGLAILAAIVIVGLLSHGCGNAYLNAYRGIATARATASTVEQSLADVCDLKRRACLETHHTATPAYNDCIDPCRKALTAWTVYTRPAINSALVAGVGSVATAEAVKGKVGLVGILKPIACALGRGAKDWIHLLPVSIKATVDAAASLVAGFACPEVK